MTAGLKMLLGMARSPRRRVHLWALMTGLAGLPGASAAQFVDLSVAVDNVGQRSTFAAWGDYDGDGDLDLYVTNWAAAERVPPNRLYRNAGDASFEDVAASLGLANDGNSVSAAWADYDNDGDLDLYVGDFFDQDYLYRNDGGGAAFTEVGRGQQMVNLIKLGSVFTTGWGDYDNDGWLDLYLGKYYHDNSLYRNQGDGRLEQQTDLEVDDRRDTNGFSWVDYDNDGDLDLYVVNREQENALYRNEVSEDGVFAEVACALSLADTEIGQAAAWSDYDNDGDLDLYVANVGANALYRNDGGDVFVDVAAAASISLQPASGWITAMAAWADYNGDGFSDLYLANGADRIQMPDVLMAGSTIGVFEDSTGLAELPTNGTLHLAAAWADADSNGSPDLYVADGSDTVAFGNRLFQNTADDTLFLRVVVRGKGPEAGGANLYGLGARVYLIDAVSNDTLAYQQVLPPAAVPRTVGDGDAAAGGSEVIFGAPAGPYNVAVLFPGNPQAGLGPNVQGGDLIVVDEP